MTRLRTSLAIRVMLIRVLFLALLKVNIPPGLCTLEIQVFFTGPSILESVKRVGHQIQILTAGSIFVNYELPLECVCHSGFQVGFDFLVQSE